MIKTILDYALPVLMVGVAVLFLWLRFKGSVRIPRPQAEEEAVPPPTPDAHPPVHEEHHKSNFLPNALLVCFVILTVAYVAHVCLQFGNPPSLSSWNQRVPSSNVPGTNTFTPVKACAAIPTDAREVIVPVTGCSAPIPVERGSYPCADPPPEAGVYRTKAWFGPDEPSSWSTTSTKGDHICFGPSDNDGKPPTSPVTIHVWLERF